MPKANQAPLPYESFSSNFRAAIASNSIISLKDLVSSEPKQKGSAHWVQSHRPKGSWNTETGAWIREGAQKKPDAALPRRQYEALAAQDKTFAAWSARRTPHKDIDFYATLCDKAQIETGHEFETDDDVDMNNSPSSTIIRELGQSFIVSGNQQVLDAILAPTSTRKMLDLNPASPTFGKIKTVTENWSTNNKYWQIETENVGFFSLEDDAAMVQAKLELCNVPNGGRKIMLINPLDAGKMVTKSLKTLLSKDYPFVTRKDISSGSGELPEMFGFSWVKSTMVKQGEMLAFVPEALSPLVPFDFEDYLERNPDLRFHPQYYAHEEWGVVANDDWGRFKIKIKTAEEPEEGSES